VKWLKNEKAQLSTSLANRMTPNPTLTETHSLPQLSYHLSSSFIVLLEMSYSRTTSECCCTTPKSWGITTTAFAVSLLVRSKQKSFEKALSKKNNDKIL
jgi:hypothetical protein